MVALSAHVHGAAFYRLFFKYFFHLCYIPGVHWGDFITHADIFKGHIHLNYAAKDTLALGKSCVEKGRLLFNLHLIVGYSTAPQGKYKDPLKIFGFVMKSTNITRQRRLPTGDSKSTRKPPYLKQTTILEQKIWIPLRVVEISCSDCCKTCLFRMGQVNYRWACNRREITF